jgi:ABC-type lipoprotein export system ATPase subunit
VTTVTATTILAVCRGVSVVHGHGAASVAALCDVDLTLTDGERVGLWGRSGSGKTTLLHVLGGLVTPTAGEVSWRGERLPSVEAAARARTRGQGIAYVFQGANLLPTFTAFENVSFAAAASDSEAGDGPPELGPAELLELVGLTPKLDALPGELSGGEAQRVAIARALAQRPSLLLCDEPTGHLDSDTGERVLDLIDALQRRLGFAQVTATHDPDVAARSDRVLRLDDGMVSGEERFG